MVADASSTISVLRLSNKLHVSRDFASIIRALKWMVCLISEALSPSVLALVLLVDTIGAGGVDSVRGGGLFWSGFLIFKLRC